MLSSIKSLRSVKSARDLYDRVQRKVQPKIFDWNLRAADRTPPLEMKPADLVILSELCHPYVRMYMVALKSLYQHLGKGIVAVLDDGSLTSEDHAYIRAHVPLVEIRAMDTIDTGRCPRGGTWERLTLAAEYARHSYVIQLDSDTLTLKDPADVRACYEQDRSFVLSGCIDGHSSENLYARMTAQEAYEDRSLLFLTPGGEHAQVKAETSFRNARLPSGFRYFRGSSGFAGFSRQPALFQRVEEFSLAMEEVLGRKTWEEWGTEQVATNAIVASSGNGCVLPYPRYAAYAPGINAGESVFLHFYGEFRWHRGDYHRLAKGVVAGLSRGSADG